MHSISPVRVWGPESWGGVRELAPVPAARQVERTSKITAGLRRTPRRACVRIVCEPVEIGRPPRQERHIVKCCGRGWLRQRGFSCTSDPLISSEAARIPATAARTRVSASACGTGPAGPRSRRPAAAAPWARAGRTPSASTSGRPVQVSGDRIRVRIQGHPVGVNEPRADHRHDAPDTKHVLLPRSCGGGQRAERFIPIWFQSTCVTVMSAPPRLVS